MKHMVPLLLFLGFLLFAQSAFALRCGNELANEGDLKHEVLLACGEPLSREVIGYIDEERKGERIRVLKIEEWIIEERGYYYSLVFEGNILVRIQSAGQKRK